MSIPAESDPLPGLPSDFTATTGEISPALLARVGRILFAPPEPPPAQVDACLILGSRNCAYRVDAALALRFDAAVRYVVSGGGRMESGLTEAAFMADRLQSRGVAPDRIVLEDSSRCTADNLSHAAPLLAALAGGTGDFRVVLVTAGFHLRRTLALAGPVFAAWPRLRIFPLPAYGPHTAPDNWHLNPLGRRTIATELAKLVRMGVLPAGQGNGTAG